MNNIEQTLSIIKPDAVERNLGEEIKIFLDNKKFYNQKYRLPKMRLQNFIKFINQSLLQHLCLS